MSDNKYFNLFDENLKIASTCPVCSNRYNPIEARIIAEKGDGHLVYLKCSQCHAAMVAVVVAQNNTMTSLGLVTDLSSDDVIKFMQSDVVSEDDALAIYQQLSRHKVVSEAPLTQS